MKVTGGEVLAFVVWTAAFKALLEPVLQRLGEAVIGSAVAEVLLWLDGAFPALLAEGMTRQDVRALVAARAEQITGNRWTGAWAAGEALRRFDPSVCIGRANDERLTLEGM